ncbi:Translin [Toxocara canis]|uniref:Translin n=1 Tax=Toxocara canis TaxID=6265 RepID=A0A0B2V749_TOXCA|nr:Translin [Toxocara canis]
MAGSGAEGSDGAVHLMFQSIVDEIEKDRALREELYDIARDLDTINREMLTALQKTHSSPCKPAGEIATVRKIIEERTKPYVKELAAKITPNVYYKYHDVYRFAMQRLAFIVTFASFLETGELLDRASVANELGVDVDASIGFHLDLEDYLFGVLNLASEVARYAINSVAAGDNARPFQIAAFVKNVDEMFRLLNLKNDALRRRYDVLKYDVQKCEQIVYDLAIRGLKPLQSPQSEATGKKSDSSEGLVA